MKRLQRIHDGKARYDGIQRLFKKEDTYTYPNWRRDKEEAMINFLKFQDAEGEEIIDVMNLKQHMYEGDRSTDSLLVELDATSFTYAGWRKHAESVEMSLTSIFKTNFGQSRERSARNLLDGMRRLQQVHSRDIHHDGINKLCKGFFTYPRCERDREEAMEYYLGFQDNYAEEVFRLMNLKQGMHDGDRSDEVLVALDSMLQFLEAARLDTARIGEEERGQVLLTNLDILYSSDSDASHNNKISSDDTPLDATRKSEKEWGSHDSPRDVMRRIEKERGNKDKIIITNLNRSTGSDASSEVSSLTRFQSR